MLLHTMQDMIRCMGLDVVTALQLAHGEAQMTAALCCVASHALELAERNSIRQNADAEAHRILHVS